MNKRVLGRSILIGLMLIFWSKTLIWGKMGLIDYFKIKKELTCDYYKIGKLEEKISFLKNYINNFNSSNFELEKTARLELQMALPDEKVYFY